MTDPREDALSTFALDIDTGSYTRFRDAVNQGSSISPSEVRTEEFVNYFEQGYQAPREGLDVSIDAAALPFREGHRLVRVGISSAAADSESRSDADLVLVVDCSGSMSEAGKMETTKARCTPSPPRCVDTDRVAMVCYSTEAEVLLEPTKASDRRAIDRAIDSLQPQASTNAEAGLSLGYDLARSMERKGRMSRVVLVSDGVANVGATGPSQILERISTQARAGTHLISRRRRHRELQRPPARAARGPWRRLARLRRHHRRGRAGVRHRSHRVARGRRERRQGPGRVRSRAGQGLPAARLREP